MLTYENCPQIYGFAKHLVTVVFSRQPRQQEEIMNLMGTFFLFCFGTAVELYATQL